jgi:peptidyl-tRNA hydrolase, PTH1 family
VALRRFRDHDRRGSASTLVIVGLANPGSEFEGSRHNVGGDAVRLLAERRGVQLNHESRQRALSATIPTERGPVTLAVPTTYMNESGAALAPLLRRTSLEDLSHLVIAHDELDLEPGRLQLKFGGGLAGHNGLRSIAKTLGTQDFSRLRIGIGKPPTKEQGADYVLQRPTGARKLAMAEFVTAAADALETLLDYEFEDAQQRVNRS